MWNFLAGVSAPKKPKTSEEKQQQLLYEKSKREWKFQSMWVNTFNWLRYDKEKNLMYCYVCRTHDNDKTGSFVWGSANFRIEPIKAHQKSSTHELCQRRQVAPKFSSCQGRFNVERGPSEQGFSSEILTTLRKWADLIQITSRCAS